MKFSSNLLNVLHTFFPITAWQACFIQHITQSSSSFWLIDIATRKEIIYPNINDHCIPIIPHKPGSLLPDSYLVETRYEQIVQARYRKVCRVKKGLFRFVLVRQEQKSPSGSFQCGCTSDDL